MITQIIPHHVMATNYYYCIGVFYTLFIKPFVNKSDWNKQHIPVDMFRVVLTDEHTRMLELHKEKYPEMGYMRKMLLKTRYACGYEVPFVMANNTKAAPNRVPCGVCHEIMEVEPEYIGKRKK